MQPITRAIGVVLGIFFVAQSYAQEVLGPMGGVGGEARRIEQQALTPVRPPDSKKKQKSAVPTPKISAGTIANAGEGWIVATVSLSGDLAFAEKMGVQQTLEGMLVGETARNREEVQEALRKVFSSFIDEGYYLARVSLPRDPYDAKTKTMKVTVEQGLMGNIRINFASDREDGRWYSREQIARRFKELKPGDTFNYKQLYDSLYEVNSHPDLTLDTKISVRKPLEGEGADRHVVRYADIDLTVKERFPLHAVLDINNHGIEAIDEWQSSLTLQYLNLTKADDV